MEALVRFHVHRLMKRSALVAGVIVLAAVPLAAQAFMRQDRGTSGRVLVGARVDDVLTGTNRDDRIYGRGGDDVIKGLGGADLLDGGSGDDQMFGNGGSRVRGGSGNEVITLTLRRVAFNVDCGPGRDRVILISRAATARSTLRRRLARCEIVVQRRPGALPAPIGPPPAPGAPAPIAGTGPAPDGSSSGPLQVSDVLASLPAASVFLSPSGSDSNACSQAAPCRSFDRAYHVAPSGAVVELAGGSYAGQSFTTDGSKTSADDVYFRPAPGAAVNVGWITFNRNRRDPSAQHISIIGVTTDGFGAIRSSDVHFYGVTMTVFSIEGGDGVSVVGGSVGGLNDSHPIISHYADDRSGVQEMDRNILIDGVHFHDVQMLTASSHTECLQVNDGDGITVRNSTFTHCDTFNVFFSTDPGFGLNNITVENNVFSTSTDSFGGNTYFALRFGYKPTRNVVVRNNYSTQEMSFDDAGADSTWRISGNVAPAGICGRALVAHNVWVGSRRCSSSDKLVGSRSALKVDAAGKPEPGSPLIDAGDPASFPAGDILGVPRPGGAAPDAGAYEVG
jgi:hypothetical protein